jgi:hypothetical protein
VRQIWDALEGSESDVLGTCDGLTMTPHSKHSYCENWKPLPSVKGAAYPDNLVGIGGAPTRATTLPVDGAERKKYPVASGVLDYFPDALVAVAHVSYVGNEQHNPGQPLNWARDKSTDEADTMLRHFLQRGSRDKDGVRHTAKMAWRALALLQKEIEAEQGRK